jgi:hypothetical protein
MSEFLHRVRGMFESKSEKPSQDLKTNEEAAAGAKEHEMMEIVKVFKPVLFETGVSMDPQEKQAHDERIKKLYKLFQELGFTSPHQAYDFLLIRGTEESLAREIVAKVEHLAFGDK